MNIPGFRFANIASCVVFSASLFVVSIANAALEIEISGGSAQQVPVAIVPFGQVATANQDNISTSISCLGAIRKLYQRET